MPKRRRFKDEEQREAIPSNVYISFTKRRNGLFNKAKTLCNLCDGTRIAIVVLSPRGKPYAYGYPSVDEVLAQTTISPIFITDYDVDEHKHQADQIIEALEFSLKNNSEKNVIDHEENINKVVLDLKNWIERECEERTSLQELEFLKQKFLSLLDKIITRLESTTTTLYNDHVSSTSDDEFTSQNSDFVLSGGGGDLHGTVGPSDVGVFDDALNVYPLNDRGSDFVLSGGGDLHGTVGPSSMGVLDDALNVYPLNDMSHAHHGSDFGGASKVHPLNNMSYTNYGSDSRALKVHSLDNMSYTNFASDSCASSWNVHLLNDLSNTDNTNDFGALNVHSLNDKPYINHYGSDSGAFNVHPLNDMSYNNYGSDFGAFNVDPLNNTSYNYYGSNYDAVELGNHIQGADTSFCFSSSSLLGG